MNRAGTKNQNQNANQNNYQQERPLQNNYQQERPLQNGANIRPTTNNANNNIDPRMQESVNRQVIQRLSFGNVNYAHSSSQQPASTSNFDSLTSGNGVGIMSSAIRDRYNDLGATAVKQKEQDRDYETRKYKSEDRYKRQDEGDYYINPVQNNNINTNNASASGVYSESNKIANNKDKVDEDARLVCAEPVSDNRFVLTEDDEDAADNALFDTNNQTTTDSKVKVDVEEKTNLELRVPALINIHNAEIKTLQDEILTLKENFAREIDHCIELSALTLFNNVKLNISLVEEYPEHTKLIIPLFVKITLANANWGSVTLPVTFRYKCFSVTLKQALTSKYLEDVRDLLFD